MQPFPDQSPQSLNEDQTLLDRLENTKVSVAFELAAALTPQDVKIQKQSLISLGEKIQQLKSNARYQQMRDHEIELRLLLDETTQLRNSMKKQLENKKKQKALQQKQLEQLKKKFEEIKKSKENKQKIQLLNHEIKEIKEEHEKFKNEAYDDGKIKGVEALDQAKQNLIRKLQSIEKQIGLVNGQISSMEMTLKEQKERWQQLQKERDECEQIYRMKSAERMKQQIKIQNRRSQLSIKSIRSQQKTPDNRQSETKKNILQVSMKKQSYLQQIRPYKLYIFLLIIWIIGIVIYSMLFYKK